MKMVEAVALGVVCLSAAVLGETATCERTPTSCPAAESMTRGPLEIAPPPLALTISLPKQQFALGEPMQVVTELKNVGTKDIRVPVTREYNEEYHIIAFSVERHRMVPFPSTASPRDGRYSTKSTNLEPGAAITNRVDVSDWADIREPGAYVLLVIWRMPLAKQFAVSNALPVIVKDAKGSAGPTSRANGKMQ